MALDSSSYNPKVVGATTFEFNETNAANQAIAYLDNVAGLAMGRQSNQHDIVGLAGAMITGVEDTACRFVIAGAIQTFDADEFWRTVDALRSALRGTAAAGTFTFYLHEDGGTNEVRVDDCVMDGDLEVELIDDAVHHGGYPRWSCRVVSEDECPTVITGGSTILEPSESEGTGVTTFSGKIKCKGFVIVDDTNTVRAKVVYDSGSGQCDVQIDGDVKAYPGQSISLPT